MSRGPYAPQTHSQEPSYSQPSSQKSRECPCHFGGRNSCSPAIHLYSFLRAALTHVPNAGWLITDMHCLIDLEARNPKSRCWKGQTLCDGSRGESSYASFSFGHCWESVAFFGLCQHQGQLHGHLLPMTPHGLLSECVCPCVLVLSFYRDTSHVGSGPILMTLF